MKPAAATLLLWIGLAASPSLAWAQEVPRIAVTLDGRTVNVAIARDRGYGAVPLSLLESLGGATTAADGSWRIRLDSTDLVISDGSPFIQAAGRVLQLAHPPYAHGGEMYLPLQILLDVLPLVLPDRFQPPAAGTATAGRLAEASPTGQSDAPREDPPARPPSAPAPSPADEERSGPRAGDDIPGARRRVVVVDAGHGGSDPGAIGAGGAREKDVALALARALAAELGRYPELEVHLTRDRDVLVPLWQRGDWATRTKGDRPGIFISLHANALPRQRSTRGFETYFLSEARTDHERRVAANENAPLAMGLEDGGGEPPPDLDFILRELRNFDHPHWSALLAELVQRELAPVHPGPDRGVKQAPFAVITNALMPAVLVEIGFITHREEERLLVEKSFHEEAARAVARAVIAFFERYPLGQATAGGPG